MAIYLLKVTLLRVDSVKINMREHHVIFRDRVPIALIVVSPDTEIPSVFSPV